MKPISLIPLYTSHLAEPGHHPLAQFLAVRALDTEHFGLVVARGRHHNGGIPGRRQGSETRLGALDIPHQTP